MWLWIWISGDFLLKYNTFYGNVCRLGKYKMKLKTVDYGFLHRKSQRMKKLLLKSNSSSFLVSSLSLFFLMLLLSVNGQVSGLIRNLRGLGNVQGVSPFLYQVFHRNALCDPLVCPSVYPSVCLSVFTITQARFDVFRMIKLWTVHDVKSDMELEDGSCTWPLTQTNWRFSMMYIQSAYKTT